MQTWSIHKLRYELDQATQLKNEAIAKYMPNIAKMHERKIARISAELTRRGV